MLKNLRAVLPKPGAASLKLKRESSKLAKSVRSATETELAMQFGITSIPTLVLMKSGDVAATMVGYRPKADILKLLNA